MTARQWTAIPAAAAMLPLLAPVSGTAGGLAIGAVFAAVLMMSAATVALCRHVIPPQFRTVYVLLIAAAWVTVAELLMAAWLFDLRLQFGIYLSVLSLNGLLLYSIEEHALRAGPIAALRAAWRPALGMACAVTAVSAVREVAGAGTLFADAVMLAGAPAGSGIDLPGAGIPLLQSAAGVFIVVGLCAAAWSSLRDPETRSDAGGD